MRVPGESPGLLQPRSPLITDIVLTYKRSHHLTLKPSHGSQSRWRGGSSKGDKPIQRGPPRDAPKEIAKLLTKRHRETTCKTVNILYWDRRWR